MCPVQCTNMILKTQSQPNVSEIAIMLKANFWDPSLYLESYVHKLLHMGNLYEYDTRGNSKTSVKVSNAYFKLIFNYASMKLFMLMKNYVFWISMKCFIEVVWVKVEKS